MDHIHDARIGIALCGADSELCEAPTRTKNVPTRINKSGQTHCPVSVMCVTVSLTLSRESGDLYLAFGQQLPAIPVTVFTIYGMGTVM